MDNFIGEFRGNVSAETCQGLIALFNEAHRGRPAPDEVKFIITGWFCFAPRPR